MNCEMCEKWQTDKELRVWEFSQTLLVLNRDQFFTGYCFLINKDHATELFHLGRKARNELVEEVSLVASCLAEAFQADKINYELLGNMVPHMHWHLIPRFINDPLWPRPIWCEPHSEVLLTGREYSERISQIRRKIKER